MASNSNPPKRKGSISERWTDEEDRMFKKMLKKGEPSAKMWIKMAKKLPGKTPEEVARYYTLVSIHYMDGKLKPHDIFIDDSDGGDEPNQAPQGKGGDHGQQPTKSSGGDKQN